jgi:uncharacterized protein (TIGR02118 family)
MIHQLIFAAPRPGLTAQQMNDHWVRVHAPRFASRIPQFKQYCVDTALEFPQAPAAPWSGVGEIWFANDEDQLASIQSAEYLEGARPDEPNFVAIWQLLVLDTQPHSVLEPGLRDGGERPEVKLIVLVKRKPGSTRAEFRARSLDTHADLALQLPGLRGYQQNHARDGHYAVGEAPLDAAYELWFDDLAALHAAAATPEYGKVLADLEAFVEPRYTHVLAVRENWIIGPVARA